MFITLSKIDLRVFFTNKFTAVLFDPMCWMSISPERRVIIILYSSGEASCPPPPHSSGVKKVA